MQSHPPWKAIGKALVALIVFGLSITTVSLAAPVAGGTLDPTTVPKYVTPLVIPPEMPKSTTSPAPAAAYDIAVRQFKQQILPGPAFPATTVWSYGRAEDVIPANFVAPVPLANGVSFNYPAFTVENISQQATTVRWINDLVDPVSGNFIPHMFNVDQTLHWANPSATGCTMPMTMTGTDCHTENPAPYTGPIPLVTHVHGAHVQPDSDGFPQAWWLPGAPGTKGIPLNYAERGIDFTQANNANTIPGSAYYSYGNSQPASTLWYHDHALGMTRLNVYAGPAGFWLIRGGANDTAANVLPGPAPAGAGDPNFDAAYRATIREIPIAIQDRSFDWADAAGNVLPNATGATQAKLFYPADRSFFDGFVGPYIGNAGYTGPGFVGPSVPGVTPLGPTDMTGIWNPEAFFNTMVVNGTTWPKLDVDPVRYRFRLLNGCNSRTLNLAMFVVANDPDGIPGNADDVLGAEVPFYQIGAEQGFLSKVVKIQTGSVTTLPGDGTAGTPVATASPEKALLMGPAERADVIVDFTGLAAGTRIRIINTAPDGPFGGFPDVAADPLTSGQVMDIIVKNNPTAVDLSTPLLTLSLPFEAALGNATNTRKVSLNELSSDQVCIELDPVTGTMITRFSVPPGDPTFIATCLGTAAITPGNIVDVAGPRLALLGVLGTDGLGNLIAVPKMWSDPITETPLLGSTEIWEIYNATMDAHPIHLHLVRFEVVNREVLNATDLLAGIFTLTGTVSAPEPNELGFKDTVVAYPGQVTRIKAQFDIAGLYVWHCHIVEHEDNEMMRQYTVVTAAAISAPANGVVLNSPTQTFTWNNAQANAYQLWIGTTPGTNNLGVFRTTGTTVDATGLPANGRTVYVTLYSRFGTTWYSNAYTYTLPGVQAAAVVSSPANTTTLAGTSQTFTWNNAGADGYQLWLGSTAGAKNLGVYSTKGTSVNVTGLPSSGRTLYVTLYSKFGAVWSSSSSTNTLPGVQAAAVVSSPANASVLGGTTQTFVWNNAGADAYQLWLGSTAGAKNLGVYTTTGTTVNAVGLPTSGRTLFATLYSKFGATWSSSSTSYTLSGVQTAAAIINPVNGTPLVGAAQTFTWSNAGADAYQLWVGSTPGTFNLGVYSTVGSTANVTGLPANGSTIYIQLNSKFGNTWLLNNYSYVSN